jgi:hypothetical protein
MIAVRENEIAAPSAATRAFLGGGSVGGQGKYAGIRAANSAP